eukprot:g15268.t1
MSLQRLGVAVAAVFTAACTASLLAPAQDTAAAGVTVDEWIWVPIEDPIADATFATVRHRIELDLHRGPIFAPLAKEAVDFIKHMQHEVKNAVGAGPDADAGAGNIFKKFKNMLTIWGKMQTGTDEVIKSAFDDHLRRYSDLLFRFSTKFHLGLMDYLFEHWLPEDPEGYHALRYGMTCVEGCNAPMYWLPSSWVRPNPLPLTSLPSNLRQFLRAPNPSQTRSTEELMDELYCWQGSLMETLVPQESAQEFVAQEARHILGWSQVMRKVATGAAQSALADGLLTFLWGKPLGSPSLQGPISIGKAMRQGWSTVVQRFPLRQTNKVRLIDPLVPQNKVSFLERSVPMTSALTILSQATALAFPHLTEYGVVKMDKRTVKKCKLRDRGYTSQTEDFLLRGGEPPLQGFFNEGYDPSVKPALGKVQFSGDGSIRDPSATSPFSLDEAIDLAAVAVAGYVVDVAKAYNNVPIRTDLLKYNRIAVFSPTRKRFAAFQALCCVFGNVHSVVGWVRPFHGLALIFKRLMKTLLEDYVDDSTGIIPAQFAQDFLNCFLFYLDLLGIPYATAKIQIGATLTVLGLLFSFTKRVPVFSIDAKRQQVITKLIDAALESGRLSVAAARKLQGKVSFVFSSLLDRTMNPILRPLFNRAAQLDASSLIHPKLKATLQAVKLTVNRQIVRVAQFERPRGLRSVLYTDASFANGFGYVAGVLPIVIAGVLKFLWWRAPVRRDQIRHTVGRQPISFLENIAALMSLRVYRNYLSQFFTYLYVDNTAAEGSLLAQGSSSAPMSCVCFEYWMFSAKHQITAWISRVRSNLNIADFFTREEYFSLDDLFIPNNRQWLATHPFLGTIFEDEDAGPLPDAGAARTVFETVPSVDFSLPRELLRNLHVRQAEKDEVIRGKVEAEERRNYDALHHEIRPGISPTGAKTLIAELVVGNNAAAKGLGDQHPLGGVAAQGSPLGGTRWSLGGSVKAPASPEEEDFLFGVVKDLVVDEDPQMRGMLVESVLDMVLKAESLAQDHGLFQIQHEMLRWAFLFSLEAASSQVLGGGEKESSGLRLFCDLFRVGAAYYYHGVEEIFKQRITSGQMKIVEDQREDGYGRKLKQVMPNPEYKGGGGTSPEFRIAEDPWSWNVRTNIFVREFHEGQPGTTVPPDELSDVAMPSDGRWRNIFNALLTAQAALHVAWNYQKHARPNLFLFDYYGMLTVAAQEQQAAQAEHKRRVAEMPYDVYINSHHVARAPPPPPRPTGSQLVWSALIRYYATLDAHA